VTLAATYATSSGASLRLPLGTPHHLLIASTTGRGGTFSPPWTHVRLGKALTQERRTRSGNRHLRWLIRTAAATTVRHPLAATLIGPATSTVAMSLGHRAGSRSAPIRSVGGTSLRATRAVHPGVRIMSVEAGLRSMCPDKALFTAHVITAAALRGMKHRGIPGLCKLGTRREETSRKPAIGGIGGCTIRIKA